MPTKRKKFESTFPAARIKRIMQLDDDVGRVASSVPIVISRALEIFLHAILSRASQFAASRSAKTMTVGHIKYCIEREKQWDFLKDLTAKLPEINVSEEMQGAPKRGRKRRNSGSTGVKAKTKKENVNREADMDDEDEEGSDTSDNTSTTSSHHSRHSAMTSSLKPSPVTFPQHQVVSTAPPSITAVKPVSSTKPSSPSSHATTLSPLAVYTASLSQSKAATKMPPSIAPSKASPLLAYTSKLQAASLPGKSRDQSTSLPSTSTTSMARTMEKMSSLVKPRNDVSSDEDYDV